MKEKVLHILDVYKNIFSILYPCQQSIFSLSLLDSQESILSDRFSPCQYSILSHRFSPCQYSIVSNRFSPCQYSIVSNRFSLGQYSILSYRFSLGQYAEDGTLLWVSTPEIDNVWFEIDFNTTARVGSSSALNSA